jgi:outer membrane immunogenic protein
MKKTLFAFAAFLMIGMGHLFAQDSKRIGAQLIYGTDINTLGIGAIAEFPVAERLAISPSFSFYFPKDEGFVKTSAFEINGNLNYTFVEENNILFYGIGGLNYTNYKVKANMAQVNLPNYSSSVGEIGLNLGAGANFEVGKNFLPFAEIKYIVGGFDRLVLAGGVKFNF